MTLPPDAGTRLARVLAQQEHAQLTSTHPIVACDTAVVSECTTCSNNLLMYLECVLYIHALAANCIAMLAAGWRCQGSC